MVLPQGKIQAGPRVSGPKYLPRQDLSIDNGRLLSWAKLIVSNTIAKQLSLVKSQKNLIKRPGLGKIWDKTASVLEFLIPAII